MANEAVKVTGTQVKELLEKAVGGIYVSRCLQNIDGGSLYVNMNHCIIHFPDVNDSYFNICTTHTEVEIDKEIVDAIYNDATESESICYRIEFNNGMSDMAIEPEQDSKVF